MAEPTLPEIAAALNWLARLCTSGGVLKKDDYQKVVSACDLAGPFVRGLRASVDSGAYPRDDLQVRCKLDATPHAMTFHRQHAEAP